mmetsp:Transcript_38828/g.44193  ORF Transcript_38828/g.44193 Transcript_38828/m.44193 type:complete len:250 (+) Transcript_38828:435-1184(+)
MDMGTEGNVHHTTMTQVDVVKTSEEIHIRIPEMIEITDERILDEIALIMTNAIPTVTPDKVTMIAATIGRTGIIVIIAILETSLIETLDVITEAGKIIEILEMNRIMTDVILKILEMISTVIEGIIAKSIAIPVMTPLATPVMSPIVTAVMILIGILDVVIVESTTILEKMIEDVVTTKIQEKRTLTVREEAVKITLTNQMVPDVKNIVILDVKNPKIENTMNRNLTFKTIHEGTTAKKNDLRMINAII